MPNFLVTSPGIKAVPIVPVCQDEFALWQKKQTAKIKNQIAVNKFSAKSATFCLLSDRMGKLEKVLLGLRDENDFLAFGILPKRLPAGCYQIDKEKFSAEQLERAMVGWGLGSYQFKQYKKVKSVDTKLLCKTKELDYQRVKRELDAIFLVRDLINTPALDLYPEKFAAIVEKLAKKFNADFAIVKGNNLKKEFPSVYAVGRGSDKEPILIDLRYGDLEAPKVVLVGKGVCFDSGGIQLKPSSGMMRMKKDKAGAAHVLGLAQMIIEAKLPINLRVIIPVVENLPSGHSLKTGDIITTRKGLTIEVLNTDAEGRLILADALALASEWQPELILDFATLTGAARVALGPDITALFASSDQLAQKISSYMMREQEPVWQMPLYGPYFEYLKSNIADFKNVALTESAGAGAILAALVLQKFVNKGIDWAHFDINAYNATNTPGKPEGGEACGLRGVFRYLENRYKNKI